MAAGDDIRWWVRTDGNLLNGGGYDAGMPSAGTNYSDQASAQLSLTDLVTSGAGVKTITSITGGFTAAMIGNCIRISAGTNFTAGYYWIDSYTNTNTITVTVSPTASAVGAAGTGRVGGAHASLRQYCSTASAGGAPAIATPLSAGMTVNIRGAGSDDSATVDYDESGQYYTFPAGSSALGPIRWFGYNGRPVIGYHGLHSYQPSHHQFKTLKAKQTAATYTTEGFISGGTAGTAANKMEDIIFDQNGNDTTLLKNTGGDIISCWFKNTGSTTAGTNPAILENSTDFGAAIHGNRFTDIRGYAISATIAKPIEENIIARCKATSLRAIILNAASTYSIRITGNTIDNCAAGALTITTAADAEMLCFAGNIISNCSGTAISFSVGTTVLNDKRVSFFDYNCYYNNGTNIASKTIGTNDTNGTDPGYTDAANNDYRIGTALKALGWPRSYGSVTSYIDPGALQRVETAGSSGGVTTPTLNIGSESVSIL